MSRSLLTVSVIAEVEKERARQDDKWGEQDHPNGTRHSRLIFSIEATRKTDEAAAAGRVTWWDILNEEATEVSCEEDVEKLREELIQVAAVAVAWVECIDRHAA